MKKRLISLLVALCMAVTLLPVSAITAWAEGGGQLKIVNGYPEGSKDDSNGTYTISCSGDGWSYDGTTQTLTLNPLTPTTYDLTAYRNIRKDENSILCSAIIGENATIVNGNFWNVKNPGSSITNYGTITSGDYSMPVVNHGTIINGTFELAVSNESGGTIENGAFQAMVTNSGTINGGIFKDAVTNHGTIIGGRFFSSVTNELDGIIENGQFGIDFSPCTVTNNGGTINGGTFKDELTGSGIEPGYTLKANIPTGFQEVLVNKYRNSCYVIPNQTYPASVRIVYNFDYISGFPSLPPLDVVINSAQHMLLSDWCGSDLKIEYDGIGGRAYEVTFTAPPANGSTVTISPLTRLVIDKDGYPAKAQDWNGNRVSYTGDGWKFENNSLILEPTAEKSYDFNSTDLNPHRVAVNCPVTVNSNATITNGIFLKEVTGSALNGVFLNVPTGCENSAKKITVSDNGKITALKMSGEATALDSAANELYVVGQPTGTLYVTLSSGKVRELLPDLCHHPGRVGAAGHIQDGCPGINAALDVGVLFCYCDDDRDVHHPRDRQQVQVRDGGIEHHAHGTLTLHVAGKVQGAHAMGGAAAHTAEHRDVGCLDDGIADGLLGRERIDREHRVRVAVADDGKVGGEYKAFQPPPVDDDAAGGIHLLGHFQDVVAQAALYVGGSFLFSCHGGKSSVSQLFQIGTIL